MKHLSNRILFMRVLVCVSERERERRQVKPTLVINKKLAYWLLL